MPEIHRAQSSQGSYGAETTTYTSRDADRGATRTSGMEPRRGYADELRGRRRADLFFEDSVVMLGILLGGAVGYVAAASLRKPDWSSRRHRNSSKGESGGLKRYFGQHEQAHASRSVAKDETTDLIASNKVESTAVYNRQGDKLGEVYNLMVGKRSGQVAYAVMSFGGFLGIGQKYHPLPWDVLTYDTDKKGYVVDADRERLMGAPHYQAGEDPFARPEYGQQVRDYWAAS